MILGEALKERRKDKKLNLKQLSEMSGVSAAFLGRVENGQRCPSARVLKKLAQPLGFAEVELLYLAGYLSPDAPWYDGITRMENLKDDLKKKLAKTFVELTEIIDKA